MIRRLLVAALLLGAAACGGATSPASRPTPAASRPASTATIAITEPAPAATLTGPTVRVNVALTGGRVVPEASTTLKPDEGHIHMMLDGSLISMTFALDQTITATPGTHVLQVEFVASDHAPFNPRVIGSTTFTVT